MKERIDGSHDDERSTKGSHEIRNQQPFTSDGGEPLHTVPRIARVIEERVIPPNWSKGPLVRGAASNALHEMAGDHLQARPVDFLTEDHQLPEFIFAKPREMVEGLDLKRTSSLRWAIPGVLANEWEHLCLHEDCLGGRPGGADRGDRAHGGE